MRMDILKPRDHDRVKKDNFEKHCREISLPRRYVSFYVGRNRYILHNFLLGIWKNAVFHRPLLITATQMVGHCHCYVMLVQCDVMYRHMKICLWVVRYDSN